MTQSVQEETASTVHASEWRDRIGMFVLLAATIGGVYLCYHLALPFLAPLAWALALAVLFSPMHCAIELKLKRPNLAATASVLIIALIVVAPSLFLADRLVGEAQKGANIIKAGVESGAWRKAIAERPAIAPAAQWIEEQFDIPGTVRDISSRLTDTGASLLRGSLMQMIGILLTFYFIFYFLRDRHVAAKALRSLLPLTYSETTRFFARITDTIHATVYGTLVVAAVQGTLGGLMFWWIGLPAPLLWGVVMAVLALVPVLGAFAVWIPAAIFLMLDGRWVEAVVLTVWGTVVVGGIDNLLYPMLIGSRLKLHTVAAFISIVGGLIVFGTSGLILGPLVLTISVLLLEIWQARVTGIK